MVPLLLEVLGHLGLSVHLLPLQLLHLVEESGLLALLLIQAGY